MTNQERRDDPLPPETVAALMHTALRRQKSGDRAGARALLRALSRQQPDDPRIWLALAVVAETRAEQRRALERVITLDPQHPLAQRGLARFGAAGGPGVVRPGGPAAGRTTPVPPPDRVEPPAGAALPAAAAPVDAGAAETIAAVEPEISARQIRWPLYLVIGLAALLVLGVAIWLRAPLLTPDERPVPTPTLLGAAQPPAPITTSAPPTSAATAARSPTAGAEARPSAQRPPATATASLAGAPASTTVLPQPTVEPSLAPGAVLTRSPWHASLLRPEHAVLLDGSIGALQPRGRFMLVLVTIGNDGAALVRIPPALFTLVDRRGNRYLPLTGASTAYLNAYGRGQRGDLSMEESIPPGGGNFSVPLIFDIPQSARDLTLRFDDEPVGWAIKRDSGATAAPTPTP